MKDDKAEPVGVVEPILHIDWSKSETKGVALIDKDIPLGTKPYTQDWVKCSERMPSFGVPVLAYSSGAESPIVAYATALSWYCYVTDMTIEITYWMPLPSTQGCNK